MQNSWIKSSARMLAIALAATACADDPASIARPDATPQFATVDAHAVSAGDDFTCALRAGAVQCQGLNNEGQAPASKTATSGIFMQIAAGGLHACALRNDGVIECWGNNNFFQAPATRTAATGHYIALSAGTYYTCALRNDGVIECWGQNSHGQAQPTFTAATGYFINVSAKRNHTCARRSTDSAVQCWGQNLDGQAPATKLAAASVFQDVAVGYNHTCALRFDGKIECWGNNFYGQAPALRTAAVGSYTRLSAGDLHTCAVRTDGKVECWGVSSWGEAPALLSPPSGTSFEMISVGPYHSCGIWQGVLQCWGRSNYGEATSDIPAIQSMIRAEPVDGPILVYYTDASDETEFQIERRRRFSNNTYGEWLQIRRAAANATGFYDWMVTEGYNYQYRVRACDEWVTCTPWRASSLVRAKVQTAPVALTSLTASLTNPTRIDVTWSHTGNESSFNVQRRIRTFAGFGPWTLVATPAADAAAYTDLDVTTGKGYTYRVQACNAIGCSAWTSSTQIINETVPDAPSEIVATALTPTFVQLYWNDNSTNEEAFQLQRTTQVGGSYTDYVTITNTPVNYNGHDDYTVASGTTYRYRVRACNVAGCSAYVPSRAVTTP
jgi:hypothetical protein